MKINGIELKTPPFEMVELFERLQNRRVINMKTSEFIKKVEELGYKVSENGIEVIVYNTESGGVMAIVSTNHLYQIDSLYQLGGLYGRYISKSLWELLIDYASTPVEEREDEKKYYLKFKGQDVLDTDFKEWVIGFRNLDNAISFCAKLDTERYHMEFTLKKLEELGIDTDLYELEEVE